jgi:hypothetical protein
LVLQVSITALISRDLGLRAVGAAVHLNDQPPRQAGEINDEAIYGHLLSEFESGLLQLSQLAPQAALSIRAVSPEVPRSFIGHDALENPHP